jgi:fucose permease
MPENHSAGNLKLAVVALLPVLSTQMIDPLLAVFSRDYVNSSVADVGLIISAFYLSSLFVKIPVASIIRSRSWKRL